MGTDQWEVDSGEEAGPGRGEKIKGARAGGVADNWGKGCPRLQVLQKWGFFLAS